MTLVGMGDLAEVSLSEIIPATEVIKWDTEGDFATAVDSSGFVADGIGDHSGGEAGVTHSGYRVGSLTERLLTYWPMNEGSGTVTADATALGYDGDINGAAWVGTGHVGDDSLLLDGIDDYILANSSKTYDMYPLSFGGWAKTGNNSQNQGICGFQGALNYLGYYDSGNTGNYGLIVYFRDDLDNTAAVTSDALFPDGAYHHIFATRAGPTESDITLYVDGSPVSTSVRNTGTADNYTNLYTFIGGHRELNGWPFDGEISELRLYDRVLSAPEVQALASRTAPSPVSAGDTV